MALDICFLLCINIVIIVTEIYLLKYLCFKEQLVSLFLYKIFSVSKKPSMSIGEVPGKDQLLRYRTEINRRILQDKGETKGGNKTEMKY